MKQWQCVQVNNHNDIAQKIMEFQEKGWSLHTYQACPIAGTGTVKHYLLFYFEKI